MPVNPTYPGVYIEELPSPVKTISGVSTSITAFIGIAKKGPIDEPTFVCNYSDYQRKFDGLWKPSHMSYSVYHYFLNGGREALIVRVSKDAKEGKFESDDSNMNLKLTASSKGTWCEKIEISSNYEDLPSDSNNFNLEIFTVDNPTPIEKFLDLSPKKDEKRYATDIINNQSEYIRIDDAITYSRPPDKTKFKYVKESASDDTSLTKQMIYDPDEPKRGILALDKADIYNLMCIPTFNIELTDLKSIYEAAEDYCKMRRAMLIMDPPKEWIKWNDPIDNKNKLEIQKENAAIFFPRFEAIDPEDNGKPRVFAPSGAIAGVFARTDSTGGIWKAPAGIEANISGLKKLSVKLTDEENGKLNSKGINCLRSFPDIGTVIWGSRTMRGADILADQWKYITVRRIALYIEESLYRGLQWVVFEPNTDPLWSQIRLNVRTFMHNLFRQGAFQGTTPKEAYLVKCDSETTQQADIDRGLVNIIVGFAPLKPAEFVILKITQLAGQKGL